MLVLLTSVLGTLDQHSNLTTALTLVLGDFYFVSVDGSTDSEGITTWLR